MPHGGHPDACLPSISFRPAMTMSGRRWRWVTARRSGARRPPPPPVPPGRSWKGCIPRQSSPGPYAAQGLRRRPGVRPRRDRRRTREGRPFSACMSVMAPLLQRIGCRSPARLAFVFKTGVPSSGASLPPARSHRSCLGTGARCATGPRRSGTRESAGSGGLRALLSHSF
jgi:hypothetical protein